MEKVKLIALFIIIITSVIKINIILKIDIFNIKLNNSRSIISFNKRSLDKTWLQCI